MEQLTNDRAIRLKTLEENNILISQKVFYYLQCDQIGQFISLWVTFQSLCQQLFCQNHPHFLAIFVKRSKSFMFLVESFLGNFYRHLATFTGHTDFICDSQEQPERWCPWRLLFHFLRQDNFQVALSESPQWRDWCGDVCASGSSSEIWKRDCKTDIGRSHSRRDCCLLKMLLICR